MVAYGDLLKQYRISRLSCSCLINEGDIHV